MTSYDLRKIIYGISYAKNNPDILEFNPMKYRLKGRCFHGSDRRYTRLTILRAARIMDYILEGSEGADEEEANLIKLAMVCIDAEKQRLDTKKAVHELGLPKMAKKYGFYDWSFSHELPGIVPTY